MRKIGWMLWFLPFVCWSQHLLVWDLCKKEQCFWVEHDVQMALKASFTQDCKNLIASSIDNISIHAKRFFHFNTQALYQWAAEQTPPNQIKALNVTIGDEEHCLPIHCHPTEENCFFDGAYIVYF
jgi:hypothetical protein